MPYEESVTRPVPQNAIRKESGIDEIIGYYKTLAIYHVNMLSKIFAMTKQYYY
jgi:hypothetical protein